MTRKQTVLLFISGLIASYLFIWPVGLMMLWFYSAVSNPPIPKDEQ